jgi:uncharacterized protein DUF4124
VSSRDAERKAPRIHAGTRRWACRVALAALVAFPTAALSQVFYKWTDAQGKVQYGDRPPKNFSGEIVRIDVDPTIHATPPALTPRPPPAAVKGAAAPPDLAAKRRELRERLAADLARARAKLEVAKAALAADSAPQDDERMVIQQRLDREQPAPGGGSSSTGGMHGSGGMHGAAARSNCRTVTGSDGKQVVICPTAMPNESYHERQRKLEEAVRVAEEELAAAEQAYRRGVD